MSRIATKLWCNNLVNSPIFGNQSSSNDLNKCPTSLEVKGTNELMIKQEGTIWDSLSWSDIVNHYTNDQTGNTRLVRQSHIGHKVACNYIRDFEGIPFTMYVCKNGFTEDSSGNVPNSSKTLSLTPFNINECQGGTSTLTKNVGFTSSFFNNMLEPDWYNNSRIVVEFGNEDTNSTSNIITTFIGGVEGTKSSSGKYFAWSLDNTRQIFNQLKLTNTLTVNTTGFPVLIKLVTIKPNKSIHLGDTRSTIGNHTSGGYNSIVLSAYGPNDNIISNLDLTWSLSNTACAEIDTNGLVKPIEKGTAAVTTAKVTREYLDADHTVSDSIDIYIERNGYYQCVLSNTQMFNGDAYVFNGELHPLEYDPSNKLSILPSIYRAINKIPSTNMQLGYNLIESEILSENWTSSHPEILSIEKNTTAGTQVAANLTLKSAPFEDTTVTITCDCVSEYGGNLSANYYIKVLGTTSLKFDLVSVSTRVGSILSNAATLWFGGVETGEDVTSLATYTSSNTSIATVALVNGEIRITGKAIGNCTITATYQGKIATLNVRVVANIVDLNTLIFSPSSITLVKGLISLKSPTTLLYNGSDVTLLAKYTSSDESIATVSIDNFGGASYLQIVGNKVGSTTITGSYNGYNAILIVNIEEEEFVDPEPDDDTIGSKEFDVRTKNTTRAVTRLNVIGQVYTYTGDTPPINTTSVYASPFQSVQTPYIADGYVVKCGRLDSFNRSDYNNTWIKVTINNLTLTEETTGSSITGTKYYKIWFITGGEKFSNALSYITTIRCGGDFSMTSNGDPSFDSGWINLGNITSINTYTTERIGILIEVSHT